MSVAVKKLEGIESVEVSLDKASADVPLKAGNTITLPQLRQVIRSSGYPTKDVQLFAVGRLVTYEGRMVLDLLNGTTIDVIAGPPTSAEGLVEISGVATRQGRRTADNRRGQGEVANAIAPAVCESSHVAPGR